MSEKSTNLELVRFYLACWVFFAHVIPWITLYGSQKSKFLTEINIFSNTMTQILQPKGALHPAVVGFLVLSGYVITIGFNQVKFIKHRRSYLKEWSIRRSFRVIPIYILGVSLGVLFFLNLNTENAKLLTGTNDISKICVFEKLIFISSVSPTGYPNCAFQGNAPLVTTSAEIGLYAIFALTAWAMLRGFSRVAAIVLAVSWISLNILTATNLVNVAFLEWVTHASSINYVFPWFLGCFLATKSVISMFEFRNQLKRIIPISFGFVTLLFFILFSGSTDLVVRQTMLIFYSLLFYFLIQFFAKRRQFKFKRLSENLGGMSYALYALHAPLVIFMIELNINIFILISVTFIATWLVYFYIEKPLRRYGQKIASKSI